MRSAHAWASGRNPLLSLCSPVTQHVPVDANNPLRAAPSYPRGPACTTPRGPRRIPPPPLPHDTHAHQPLIVHSQPTYPAYYLREPRYGLPPPPPPPSPLPAVPPPDHRDLELAYLRGHVAGLDRRTENPPPPQEAARGAPPAPQGPAPNAVGETMPALLVAPVQEAVPRVDRRPPAPTEAPRRPQGTTDRRSRSPRRDPRDDHQGHSRPSPGRDGRMAYRRPYRSPERYYECRSEKRSSGHRAPTARGRDRTPDRRDDRSETRPAQPPGPAESSGAPMTGAGAAPLARIPLGACGMTRQTRGADRSGSPVRLPTPNPRISRRTNPRASVNATVRKAGSLRRSRPRAPRTGSRHTL